MNKDDITILIQGPVNEISLHNIENYKKIANNIVIHYWDDKSLPDYIKDDDSVVCVSDKFPSGMDGTKNVNTMKRGAPITFYYQVMSVYRGLANCTTPYTIRTRSDEYYEDLSPLVDLFEKNTNKLVCGNIFLGRWSHSKYHIGDHLFIAETEILRNAYKFLYDAYTQDLLVCDWIDLANPYTPEAIVAKSYLRAKGVSCDDDIEVFKENFNSIDINLLGNFIASWNAGLLHTVTGNPPGHIIYYKGDISRFSFPDHVSRINGFIPSGINHVITFEEALL